MSDNNPFLLSGSNIISPEQKVSQLSDPIDEEDSKFRLSHNSEDIEFENLEDDDIRNFTEAHQQHSEDANMLRMTGTTANNLSIVHEDPEREDAASCNLSRISKKDSNADQTPSKGKT